MKNIANKFLKKISLLVTGLMVVGLVNSCDDLDLPKAGSIADTEPPVAAFSYASDADNALKVQFTNLSTEAISFTWDFGEEGKTAPDSVKNAQDPVYTYSELGTYTVSLTATDGLGVSTTYSEDIVVEEGPYQPVIMEAGFEDGMLGDGTGDGRDSWRTSFETVIQISSSPVVSGSQAGKLTGDPNDQRVGYQEIVVGPDTQYDLSFIYTLVAAPAGFLTVDVLDVSRYAKDNEIEPDGDTFADNGETIESSQDYVLGSITVNNQDDPQEYLPASFSFETGESTVVAILFYNKGSVEARLDDFAINIGAGGAIPPSVSFSAEQSSENYLEYTFVNNTKGADTYLWDFGDGNTSTEENPTHIYETHNVYEVSLKATASNGLNSSFSTSIDIQAPVTADFTFEASADDYQTINFTDASVGAESLLWEFGDGFQFTGDSPSHTYMSDGSYEVKLTATSVTGNTDVKTATVTISKVFVPVILEAGFEDNSLPDGTGDGRDSWRVPSGSDLGGVIQITSSPVLSGSQAAKFPSDNSRAAYQEVTVEANTNYTLNFNYTMKTSPTGSLTVSVLNGPVTSKAEVAGATIASKTVNDQSDASAYISESLGFNSGSSTTIVIYITNTDVEARVDDLSIMQTKLPEVLEASFEDNSLPDGTGDGRDSWRTPSGSDLGGVIQITSSPVLTGSQAAKLPSDNSRAAYQEIEVEANTDYVLNYNYTMKTSPTGSLTVAVLNGPITSKAEVAGATIASETVNDQTDANTYIAETLAFNSGSSTKIVIYITNTDVESRVDDISITLGN
ncbi:PKD domain-containing protein [Marinoscillum furvescens]|uniref:PKD domain-containing protein n=1 Tax=Marinoscillum furvescens DSM 4134 TaxID=1122208 RepID=A0A3D9L087_MARFU|nr:PKD domain-containing protein [Marinoscillum furvescens]RED96597.1 PKD domain-containing protein [Marinoscillum furvescens DSM 4134]